MNVSLDGLGLYLSRSRYMNDPGIWVNRKIDLILFRLVIERVGNRIHWIALELSLIHI